MITSRPSLGQFIGGIALCEAVGIAAGIFTSSSVNSWYQTLVLPTIAPPNWVFAPVWTVLYAMMGVALAYLWASPPGSVGRVWALRWFWIQLALNFAWSAVFFGMRAPAAGYAIICLLWFAIIATMWTGARAAKPVAWWLLPYLLWVTYASALNFGILSLNVLREKVEIMDADPANANSPLTDEGIREKNQRAADEARAKGLPAPLPEGFKREFERDR